MLRIFHPVEEHTDTLHITGDKAHYLSTVLRCKSGDDIVIFDGRGSSYEATVMSVSKKAVSLGINKLVQENTESPLNIILLQGLLKGEKMDLVIQKTTELGVKEIVPVITERSQLRQTRKVGRWTKIAEDAARQCGRSVVPVVHDPVEFEGCLPNEAGSGLKGRIRGLMFWEEKGLSLKEAVHRIFPSADYPAMDDHLYLLIGPEGGFTKQEAQSAESKGFVITSLGSRILRTETAAITATAIVQFMFGDLG